MFDRGERNGSPVSDELSGQLAQLMAEADAQTRRAAFYFLFEVAGNRRDTFFGRWATEQFGRYARQITEEATASSDFRQSALLSGAITLERALAMPGHIGGAASSLVQKISGWTYDLQHGRAKGLETDLAELRIVGRYLIKHPAVPWVRATKSRWYTVGLDHDDIDIVARVLSDEPSGLGFAAIFAIYEELAQTAKPRSDLSSVPMPHQFRKLFRDWAERRVNFVEILSEEPA